MEKNYSYKWTKFSADVLKEAANNLFAHVDFKDKAPYLRLSVKLDDGEWTHDDEEEFLNDYRRSTSDATYQKVFEGHEICVHSFSTFVYVKVKAPTRSKIQSVFNIFDKYAESSRLPKPEKPAEPPPPKPTVFIGHGRDLQWRDLKDHLHDKHGYDIETYEIGARAGHAVRDILQDMLIRSSCAILVMTGEDETQDGKLRARPNVIHEIGLFQGRLGFNRAIVVLEKGTEEFSNIQGIEQIRFDKGNIKETFGDVLAVLRREFPKSVS
ncbi:nucleotide-binding protein [bacterium]|nr:nucleotide-binding protein [bacterium]